MMTYQSVYCIQLKFSAFAFLKSAQAVEKPQSSVICRRQKSIKGGKMEQSSTNKHSSCLQHQSLNYSCCRLLIDSTLRFLRPHLRRPTPSTTAREHQGNKKRRLKQSHGQPEADQPTSERHHRAHPADQRATLHATGHRRRDQGPVQHGVGDVPEPAIDGRHPATGGHLRRHPRTVRGPDAHLRTCGLPSFAQLPLPWRLRGPWPPEHRDRRPAAGLQSALPGQLLPSAGQPRVQQHQPRLRVPGRDPTPLPQRLSKPVDRLQPRLRLASLHRARRRSHSLHAWWHLGPRPIAASAPQPATSIHRLRRAQSDAGAGSAVGRPGAGHPRLREESARGQRDVRRGRGRANLQATGHRSDRSRSPGGPGRRGVLLQPPADHALLGPPLRGPVQQLRSNNDHRRESLLLIPSVRAH